MQIFWSELHGNAVKKAKGTLTLRKQEVPVFQCSRSSEVLILNNSLNIKLRKKL